MKKIFLVFAVVLVLGLTVSCSFVDTEPQESVIYLDFSSKGLGYSEYMRMDLSKNPFLGMYTDTIEEFFGSFGVDLEHLEGQDNLAKFDKLKGYIASFYIPNEDEITDFVNNATPEQVQQKCKEIGEKIVFNMSGVAEQDIPMIPGLATETGNVNSFVNSYKRNEGKIIGGIYGFDVKLLSIKENNDGYFARYYLLVPGNNKPFYQIDFYYSSQNNSFSYRGLMMLTMGMEQQDNDAIRYFQMNNVKVDSSKKSFKADPINNNFRVDVFEFMSNKASQGHGGNAPIDGFDIQTWGVAMNFTNDIVASTGLNPKSLVDFDKKGFMLFKDYVAIDSALENICTGSTKNDYSNNAIVYVDGVAQAIKKALEIETLEEVHVGLDPEVWTLDTAKEFMKSYYTWDGEESPFDRDYNSMAEFNAANLKLEITGNFHEESGIYYPAIFSRRSKTGAILNPKNWVTVSNSEEEPVKDFGKNGFNGGFNLIYKINFYKNFRSLGFEEEQDFPNFVMTLLKACGLSESMYYDLYPAQSN